MLGDWSPELQDIIRANWVVNPWSKRSKFLGLDELMEEIVCALKDQYNPGGSDSQDIFLRKTIARCIIFFMAIKDDIRQGLGLRKRSGNHVKEDRAVEVQTLLRELMEKKVVRETPGRGKSTLSDPQGLKECPDLFGKGMEKLINRKFWRSFLLKSPRCNQLMSDMNILGNMIAEDEEDEEDDVAGIGM